MKSRSPILAFVLMGLFCLAALAQTQQTPRTVTVVGAAMKSGTYEMRNTGLTLVQVVAMSGGLHPRANSSMIQVVRLKEQAADSNLSENISVDFRRILSGKVQDFQLRPGDIIFIPFSMRRFPADPPVTPSQKDIARIEANQTSSRSQYHPDHYQYSGSPSV